jgi:hypothetical protein
MSAGFELDGQEFVGMSKIDVAKLEQAYEGETAEATPGR